MARQSNRRTGSRKRAANRDAGDVVYVAEQYYTAQQDELDLMKRGTPRELKEARKRTKETKEALESLTGANRELYGSMGGGTVGAALGSLSGNVFVTAIGSLVGSVVGSVLARPSLPSARDDDDEEPRRDRREGRGGDVIQFPRRVSPRSSRAANALKRRLTEL